MRPPAGSRLTVESLEERAVPALVADFALQDLNPASATFEDVIGPATLRGQASAYYFINPG